MPSFRMQLEDVVDIHKAQIAELLVFLHNESVNLVLLFHQKTPSIYIIKASAREKKKDIM